MNKTQQKSRPMRGIKKKRCMTGSNHKIFYLDWKCMRNGMPKPLGEGSHFAIVFLTFIQFCLDVGFFFASFFFFLLCCAMAVFFCLDMCARTRCQNILSIIQQMVTHAQPSSMAFIIILFN